MVHTALSTFAYIFSDVTDVAAYSDGPTGFLATAVHVVKLSLNSNQSPISSTRQLLVDSWALRVCVQMMLTYLSLVIGNLLIAIVGDAWEEAMGTASAWNRYTKSAFSVAVLQAKIASCHWRTPGDGVGHLALCRSLSCCKVKQKHGFVGYKEIRKRVELVRHEWRKLLSRQGAEGGEPGKEWAAAAGRDQAEERYRAERARMRGMLPRVWRAAAAAMEQVAAEIDGLADAAGALSSTAPGSPGAKGSPDNRRRGKGGYAERAAGETVRVVMEGELCAHWNELSPGKQEYFRLNRTESEQRDHEASSPKMPDLARVSRCHKHNVTFSLLFIGH